MAKWGKGTCHKADSLGVSRPGDRFFRAKIPVLVGLTVCGSTRAEYSGEKGIKVARLETRSREEH